MRAVYTALADITISASKTMMYLQAPATAVLEILSVHVTDYNNNTSEQWKIGFGKITTIGSAAGTSVTAIPHEAGDQAAATTTIKSDCSVEPTTFTAFVDEQGVSNLAGYHYDPIPEERPVVAPSAYWGLKMISVPTSTSIGVMIIFREIG
jgi:hypothetical protein